MKLEQKWLYWAAGLLDGEGCFTIAKRKEYGYPRIICNMTDKEPIARLQALFGGSLTPRKQYIPGAKQAWGWEVGSGRAAGIMTTLYPLMSPRRQKRIREVMEYWKRKPNYQTKTCRKGHEYTPETTTYTIKYNERNERKKYRLCRTCLQLKGDIRANGKAYDDVL